MGMFGLKRKRTREEQKAYEEKVHDTVRDKTIVITTSIFRITRIDKGIRKLQVITEKYQTATVALLGGVMSGIFLYFVIYGNVPRNGGTGTIVTDSVHTRFSSLPDYYGDVFRMNRPADFVERTIREMQIDTTRYRTDTVYRLEVNKEFILRYGHFDIPGTDKDSTDSINLKTNN